MKQGKHILTRTTMLLVLVSICSGASAAIEYLRLEGTLDNDALGLDPVVVVYFDFAIDLSLEVEGEDYIFNYPFLYASLFGGSYSGSANYIHFSTPAINYSYRFIDFSLSDYSGPLLFVQALDCFNNINGECDNFFDFDVQVGDHFILVPNLGSISFTEFGQFTVTYRGSESPPPVPVPPAIVLMVSAIVGVMSYGKRKRG